MSMSILLIINVTDGYKLLKIKVINVLLLLVLDKWLLTEVIIQWSLSKNL